MTAAPMTTLVLARGLGRRMREADGGAPLDAGQEAAARAGQKGMMPVGPGSGRPFLDYVLGSLADANCRDVILVVAPEHDAMRERYAPSRLRRLSVRFAVQAEATGTAHAVLAAAGLVGDRPFLVVNADNLYPEEVLRQLAALDGPGLPAFERKRLVEESGFPEDRVAQFAVLRVDPDGSLRSICEKPSAGDLSLTDPRALISMNAWRFDQRIFEACADVPRSARGEHELPEAVGLALRRGVRFRVFRASGAVLDLSRRADVDRVSRQLAGREPQL